MNFLRSFPRTGFFMALLTAAGMVLAGAGWKMILTVTAMWIASLFTGRVDAGRDDAQTNALKPAPAPKVDMVEQTIEPLGYPLLVIEGSRIELANAAARKALGLHIPGQDVRIALRHPDAMRLINAGDGASVTVKGFTSARSVWQLTRREIGEGRWMIELVDRTAEADVSRAHTDFVANASHELRTPLASVIGYVETLADDDGSVDQAASKRFLGIVLREARRMLTLVEDLMSLSVVEAEKHDRPRETVDLRRLVQQVVTDISSVRGKEKVQLQAGDIPALIRGEPRQLDQLLRNLIDNALKYGDPEAPVTVRLAADEAGEVLLTVEDRGPGIAAEHLPHLTRRFYRTDPGRSRAKGGTGLGLAIVKHIVERHGGRLEITSEPGVGTKVAVSLPLAVAAEAA